jgi:flagellar hook protein FlgE
MGVFGAMTTALSGLRSQAYSLENISGNIANSRTTGFKRVDTSFVDLVPDAPQNRALAGSVLSRSSATNSVQGDIASSNIATNVALNGDGFFIVAQKNNDVGGLPTFNGINMYTRRGDFDFDANGYLVNGAGYFLKGLSIDPITGNPRSSEADVIRITGDALPPRQTTLIEYGATLPPVPQTAAYDVNTPGSDLLGPIALYPTSATFPAAISATDSGVFAARSLQAGTITVYDNLGQGAPVRLAWAKTGANTWNLYVQSDPAAVGAAPMWEQVGGAFTFGGPQGQLTSAPVVALPAMTINGVNIAGVNINTTVDGTPMSQVEVRSSKGQIQANSIRQDGYSAGVLQRTEISGDGRVVGTYSNGQVAALAQLQTARFASPNSLKRLDGGAFEETVESGLPLIGTSSAGGTQLVGGALEQSNTDIADEFSKMIVTQQAYSANTRVITTSQQMLSDIINIIR